VVAVTVRITAEQAVGLGLDVTVPKKAKYHNRPKWVDGIRFASTEEADFYSYLKILKKAGEVVDFVVQPPFPLRPAFEKHGIKFRAEVYFADFTVNYADGRRRVYDVKGEKGSQTPLFRSKRANYTYLYEEPLYIVTRDGRGWKESLE
jgi:hypothetical protein